MNNNLNKGTAIGRVRGLGSAHSGAHHWLLQRFTAIGNLVLLVWLAASLLLLPNLSYITVHDWIIHPVPAIAMALLILSTFWHARLGVQVVIEDYVHNSANKFACVTVINLAVFAGVGFGVVTLLRLALGAA